MPSLQEIERLKTILNELADEPAILAERGEEIEDVLPGGEDMAAALGDLLGQPGQPGIRARAETAPAVAPEESFDASSLVASDEELGELDSFEDFDFARGEAAGPSAVAGPPAEPAPPAEEVSAPESPGAGAEEDVLAALGLTAEALSGQEPAGEESAEEGPGEEAPEAPAEVFEEVAGQEQIPSFEELSAGEEIPVFEEAGGGELSLPEAEAEGDEFGIPPGLFAPGEQEEAPEEGAFGEEAFELPEEFRLPEEEAAGAPPEEAPPVIEEAAEAPAEPSEEEAEFLRALQEEILPGGEEEQQEAPYGGGQVDLGAPPEAPVGEGAAGEGPAGEELVFDEFSLEGLGEEFALPAQAPQEELAVGAEAAEAAPEMPPEIPPEIPAELGAEIGAEVPPVAEAEVSRPAGLEEAAPGEELSLSDKQFAVLRRTTARLPRNLKIAIEELIAERGLAGEKLRTLVGLLVEGAAPLAIAAEVSQVTGTRIAIPKSFEKLTGLEFEEERRRFAYAFRENILPIVRVALLSLGVVALLGFLGYRFVYRPVQAQLLYRQGYSQIERQRFQLANERFDQALRYWVFKGWFYRYAEAFRLQRQYTLAADKYEELLRRFPGDRKGVLGYARLLTYDLAGYERATELASGLLEKDLRDYDALLALGDNYLEWAAETPAAEAASLYDKARFHYASIIDYHGQRDEVLLRMMRYFIRTDKETQARDLKTFLDRSSLRGVPPELYASVYAELAGYWMDKGQYDGIADMLFDAMEAQAGLPEIHYNLARYYAHVRDAGEEARALSVTLGLLEQTQPLTKPRLRMLIDTYRRQGENYSLRQEYLEADRSFKQAIARIEEVQGQGIFGREEEEMFGRVYEDQGDILYYVSRDLSGALDLYLEAVKNGHRPPRLDYKIGYVHYTREEFEEALLRFSTVVDRIPRNENALFALGNALYLGGFYSSAQGYYLRLLDLLETREESIPLLMINENPEHRALAGSIMKTYNNLGVTLYRLAARSRDLDKESGALVNLTFSSEYFDGLSRDPETAARGVTRNLAYLNQRGILYPEVGFDPQIYGRIPIDLETQGL